MQEVQSRMQQNTDAIDTSVGVSYGMNELEKLAKKEQEA